MCGKCVVQHKIWPSLDPFLRHLYICFFLQMYVFLSEISNKLLNKVVKGGSRSLSLQEEVC